jgi:hypothetical protein
MDRHISAGIIRNFQKNLNLPFLSFLIKIPLGRGGKISNSQIIQTDTESLLKRFMKVKGRRI